MSGRNCINRNNGNSSGVPPDTTSILHIKIK